MLNEVTFEHESIKSILESNQKAWLKPMGKHVLSNDASDCLPTQGMMDDEITSPNQFTILLDVDVNSKSSSEEETISPDDLQTTELTEVNQKLPDFKAQINYYRSVQQFKYNHNKGRKRKTNLSDDGNTTEQSQVLNQNKVLIIGDSMLKNIDNVRIERAFRGKASSHSYSGATITNLHN